MEELKLESQLEVIGGRVQYQDIAAYYERHILSQTGEMSYLIVSFYKIKKEMVPLNDGTREEEEQETNMNAFIELKNKLFECKINQHDNALLLWKIFLNIYDQLKTE